MRQPHTCHQAVHSTRRQSRCAVGIILDFVSRAPGPCQGASVEKGARREVDDICIKFSLYIVIFTADSSTLNHTANHILDAGTNLIAATEEFNHEVFTQAAGLCAQRSRGTCSPRFRSKHWG